ncbi:MAG: ATP-dependent helicase, box family [Devosia sp.]|uniref:DEAD/DEAH box helicase n=1 Tax=Devosia sp. TaxID=1871048 RepID=UPI0026165AAC|nr:DEAD/DEAH box helicase [Devosia sp.]MDB5541658.1 ATP-dependent helicase, box family [Devosia sp.]
MNLPETIHPALAAALVARGYDTLTPVQLSVLEPEAADRDLLVSAQTGSGKTVAFGMAIAPTLLGEAEQFDRAAAPLALLIAPTRELAMQVQRELEWLYAEAGAQIAAGVGGMDIRTERRAFERGAHIVVGTPGRLRDHISKGALDLGNIRAIVLDEADEMLDLGFREDLEFILDAAPETRRTLMFSATVPRAIADLAKTFQRDALRLVATSAGEQHADIEYQQIVVRNDEREHAVINMLLLHDSSNTIVFCHTRESVKHLTARLANRGFPVVALSGELTQAERTNALQAMRDGRARICVATDVAARGIDLPNLDLVIHADVPSNPETLLHRSGRTGRAGRKGICALIVPVHRRSAAARVLRAANLDSSTRGAPTIAEIDARNREQILAQATEMSVPDEAEAAFAAELLSRLTPEQLAAAYIRRELAARPAPEEVSEQSVGAFTEKAARRDKRFPDDRPEASGPREKAPPMENGRWFTLSLGRNRRADPKWLLPMICKAGDVTKRDVGSIKILDNETRFEISADQADAFAAAIARTGGVIENGITVAASGAPSAPPKKSYNRDSAPRFKPRDEAPRPARDDGPRYKVRSDKGAKLATRPAREITPPVSEAAPAAREPVLFNRKSTEKPKANPKDKGKPKYKNRTKHEPPAAAGAAPRKRKQQGYDPLG